jgi:hypothetical protein
LKAEYIISPGTALKLWLGGSIIPDGSYTIQARSLNALGEELASQTYDFKLANQQNSGLKITVNKPDASIAAGAQVAVYHRYYHNKYDQIVYERVWEGSADIKGQVIVPGSLAKDGNDYVVTALGTEPNFFYYQMLRSPGNYTLVVL